MDLFPIINFYKFVQINDVDQFRLEQMRLGAQLGLKGTILLASEGINVGLSGSQSQLESYLKTMQSDARFADLRVVWSEATVKPFRRLKVKKKNYIVVFDPKHPVQFQDIHTAPYMDPQDWHEKLKNKNDDVIVLDTRNYYEYDYGTFAGAEQLNLRNFRQFADKFLETYGEAKDKTYLMFCTGGIRCEKAAVFARQNGFKSVYQLDGGILKYFEDVGRDDYQGNCFVFDNRWAVTPDMEQSSDGPHPDQLDRVRTVL